MAGLLKSDDVEENQLIRHAGQAMYFANEAGNNRHQLFDTAQDNMLNI